VEINGKAGFTPNGVHISTFPKHRRGIYNALTQLVQMQRRLHERSMNDQTATKDIASCACAWQRLEDQRQILLGRGKPKPVDPVNGQVKRKPRSKPAAWEEPVKVPVPDQPSTPQVVQEPTKPDQT